MALLLGRKMEKNLPDVSWCMCGNFAFNLLCLAVLPSISTLMSLDGTQTKRKCPKPKIYQGCPYLGHLRSQVNYGYRTPLL